MDDRLQRMLDMQRDLQKIMPPHREFPSPDPNVLMEQIRNNVLSAVAELIEALDETGWKPWASSNHLNHKAFHGELIDHWHFFMNLMILGDLTADELYEGYMAKHEKNRKRQADGYDGLNKCPQCKRAYDDDGVACVPQIHDSPGMLWATSWCAVEGNPQ